MRKNLFLAGVASTATLLLIQPLFAQRTPLPTGVEKICSISFSKDSKRPARVEDSALPCLRQAAATLKQSPQLKLVLIGISHPLYDHADQDRGMEREGEDMTGSDIRFSDVAAYRAVNTKAYLTKWLGSDPARILPTTDEYALGQSVLIFSVPSDADFFHNYTRTTPTNESRCTITPCPNPEEDVLTPQPRPRIPDNRELGASTSIK
jgi:hypothetical protein